MNTHLLRPCALLLGVFTLGDLLAAPAGSKDEVPEGLSRVDWGGIREAYEAGRHAFVPVPEEDGHWQATNPGQQWTAKFDGDGFLTSPKEGNWKWGLELFSYGVGEMQSQVINGSPRVTAEGQRLRYDWDATIQEWWVNDSRGLEHGYVVAKRPEPSEIGDSRSHLTLVLATRGDLVPQITSDKLGVVFANAAGAPVVKYAGLKVWDADGRILPSHFEAAEERRLRLVVEDAGARYPVTIDPVAQQAYLKASNAGAGDHFGYSVAVSGDTVVVGASGEASNATGIDGNQSDNSANYAGAAYVFVRNGTTWTQQAYLKASNTGAGDNFGHAVAVSGDTVVVGAVGEASSATGIDGNQSDDSVNGAGAAYVFVRNGTTWTQQAYLKASNTGVQDNFGVSVAVSGDTVVVGANGERSLATGVGGDQMDDSASGAAGAAYVFTRIATVWTQQAYLKASNTGANDNFGFTVAASGDTVVVGARWESSNATGINGVETNDLALNSGAAYVFERSGSSWTQQAYLKASNAESGDLFGWAVSVSGDTVVVGAKTEGSSATGIDGDETDNSVTHAGAVYVFSRSNATWEQQAYLKASNTGVGDFFGESVSVSGDTIVVGASTEDSNATGVDGNGANNSYDSSGAAYVFARSGTVWEELAYLKASNTGSIDLFGYKVAVSGDTVIVGAHLEDSNATGINGNEADNSASEAGAAYLFSLTAPPPEPARLSMPPSYRFPTTPVGKKSRFLQLVLRNAGGETATGIRQVVVGGGRLDFQVSQPFESTLRPGASTSMKARFTPKKPGLRRATITVYSNSAPATTQISGVAKGKFSR